MNIRLSVSFYIIWVIYIFNKFLYLICKQAEEERKEQKMNRKRRSMAGKLGAKKRWSEESLEEDENTRNNTSRRKT